ncbi:AMP-binding protein [Desulfobacula sp.]|uniref:AMP-binding protein n=1 Tax=Desulfobacula sp. TaxID=2593537 RepID=UPI0027144F3B|nr:class I adenylate-forming enzyme family protein [Desulfobacula sp.]
MQIIYEREIKNNIKKLDDLWNNDSTFIFLPDHSGINNKWLKKSIEKIPNKYCKDHFALLTSGSTGQPKIVIGNKERSEKLAFLLHEVQFSDPVKATILALPLSYCYAFVNQWLWARVHERSLMFTEGLKYPDRLKEVLLNADNAMLCLIGAQVPLMERYYSNNDFPGVIRVHFAGGKFPQRQIEIVEKIFPNAKIFNNYGCAEAMPRLTLRKLEESDDFSNIGKPLPGIEMKTGSKGEILFRSPFRAIGFIDKEGSRFLSDDEWIPSGDFGEEVSDGYWKLKGRSNEVFKRYGEKISLPQLLDTVNKQWNGQAVFYNVKDKNGEDAHVLVLSPQPAKEDIRRLLQMFRKKHTRPHWPLRIEGVSQMPLLSNGKIDNLKIKLITDKIIFWEQIG